MIGASKLVEAICNKCGRVVMVLPRSRVYCPKCGQWFKAEPARQREGGASDGPQKES